MRLICGFLFAGVVVAGGLGAQAPAPKTTFTGDLGFVNATGNTELSTLNVADKLVHTDGALTLTQAAGYIYGTTSHVESANLLDLSVRGDYAWRPRFGGFAGADFERNTFAGFKGRTDESIGLLWRAIVAPEDSLSLDGGFVYTEQQNVDTTSTAFPAARLAANYKHTFTKASYFQQLLEYIPDLQSAGGYRVNSASALVAPLSAHLGIKAGYVIHYDSHPPPKFGPTDRELTTGIQITW